MQRSQPAEFDQQLYDEAYSWFTEERKRQEVAEQRHRELIRTHEQGWKVLAQTIGKGLSEIASAIRDHGRR